MHIFVTSLIINFLSSLEARKKRGELRGPKNEKSGYYQILVSTTLEPTPRWLGASYRRYS